MENMAEERQPEVQSSPEVQLNWKDITEVLQQKLTSKAFDITLQYIKPHVFTTLRVGDRMVTFSMIYKK